MTATLILPNTARSLPTPADFARVATLPIVQLFVVGRSGSSLVHAFLDDHPDVLHLPHTFKYYDFFAHNPDLRSLSPIEIARRFVTSPLATYLLDSKASVIIGGRLGPERGTYLRIDVDRFCDAFASALDGTLPTERTIFLGLVLAYGWCVGQDLQRVRIVLQHLHHGDWLWPERLIERYNYWNPKPSPRGDDLLIADKYLLSLRHPYDALLAYVKFCASHGLPDTDRLDLQEKFFGLLFQDWDRLAHVERSGLAHQVIRLEDLRIDAAATMRACARWLGIDESDDALNHLTYYGYAWHGDIYTEPSTTVLQRKPPRDIHWQERRLCDAVLGPEARRHGYAVGWTGWLKWRLLPLTVLFPDPTLMDPSITSRTERRKTARVRARRRIAFVRELASRWTS